MRAAREIEEAARGPDGSGGGAEEEALEVVSRRLLTLFFFSLAFFSRKIEPALAILFCIIYILKLLPGR